LVNYRMGDIWTPQLSVKEALLSEVEHFAQCIEGKAHPITSGESGLRVLSLLEGATQSLRRRGQPIELIGLKEAS
ncbi:MAG: gfo/Idh/MocA family oxidoreductase, partial [Microvirga sp.]